MQKALAANALSKLCAVVAFAIPMIFATGYAYKAVTGIPLQSAMFKTYTILQDAPGADACSEDGWKALLVTNATHIVGIFTYALVIGVVSDEVSNAFNNFKRGNGNVFESGHTVVLNKNRHTPSLLKQWAIALREGGRKGTPVVLLADIDKEELDAFANDVRAETGMDVIARQGRPYDIDDLLLVSANTARSIILMDPILGEDWNEKMVPPHAATLVSLASIGAGPTNGQTVVMQLPDSVAGVDTVRSAARLHRGGASGDGGVVVVSGLQAVSELQAQCAIQPGLAQFHNCVFMQSESSPEFYVGSFPSLEGKTYETARRSFQKASIVGYRNAATGLHLNPPDSYVLQPGDDIVGLTADVNSFVPRLTSSSAADAAPEAAPLPVDGKEAEAYCNKNIIVLCFDKPAPQVTEGLQGYMPQRGKVTYVSLGDVTLPRGNFTARHVAGSPSSTSTLLEAGIDKADSVILTGVDEWDPGHADIQILSSIAQLADVCGDLNRTKPLHVVAQARGGEVDNFKDALSSMTAPREGRPPAVTTDILFAEDIVAGVLTQSAMEPKIASVITDIIDSSGARITMRSPQHYVLPDETLTMAQLEDRARLHGDTVVGFYRRDGSMVCGCPKSERVAAGDMSHLIIVSDTLKW